MDTVSKPGLLWQQPGLQGQPVKTVKSSRWVYREPWKRDGCCENVGQCTEEVEGEGGRQLHSTSVSGT